VIDSPYRAPLRVAPPRRRLRWPGVVFALAVAVAFALLVALRVRDARKATVSGHAEPSAQADDDDWRVQAKRFREEMVSRNGLLAPSDWASRVERSVASLENFVLVATEHGTHGLDREAVLQVVRQHVGELGVCYSVEARKKPDLHGVVLLSLSVDRGGSVASSQIEASTLGNDRLHRCLMALARTWQFPASDGPTDVDRLT
jgi:hypothetical protein